MKLEHYSQSPDLLEHGIDPAYHGKGVAGAEKKRKVEPDWTDRSYHYIAGTKPEQTVGAMPFKYSSEVPDEHIYDYAADPQKLKEKSLWGQTIDRNLYEKNIKAAGFKGYRNPALDDPTMANVVALFHPIKPGSKENHLEKSEEPEMWWHRRGPRGSLEKCDLTKDIDLINEKLKKTKEMLEKSEFSGSWASGRKDGPTNASSELPSGDRTPAAPAKHIRGDTMTNMHYNVSEEHRPDKMPLTKAAPTPPPPPPPAGGDSFTTATPPVQITGTNAMTKSEQGESSLHPMGSTGDPTGSIRASKAGNVQDAVDSLEKSTQASKCGSLFRLVKRARYAVQKSMNSERIPDVPKQIADPSTIS